MSKLLQLRESVDKFAALILTGAMIFLRARRRYRLIVEKLYGEGSMPRSYIFHLRKLQILII